MTCELHTVDNVVYVEVNFLRKKDHLQNVTFEFIFIAPNKQTEAIACADR